MPNGCFVCWRRCGCGVAFTMTVYQHVMPGLQAQAACTFETAVFGN